MNLYKARDILKSIKAELMKIPKYNRPSTAEVFDKAIKSMELRERDGLVMDISLGTPEYTPPPMPECRQPICEYCEGWEQWLERNGPETMMIAWPVKYCPNCGREFCK